MEIFPNEWEENPYQIPVMRPCTEFYFAFLFVKREVCDIYVTCCFEQSRGEPFHFSVVLHYDVGVKHLIERVNCAVQWFFLLTDTYIHKCAKSKIKHKTVTFLPIVNQYVRFPHSLGRQSYKSYISMFFWYPY